MKRKTRPLDETEYRQVEVDKSLGVELLHDTTEYVLKWPESSLAKLIMSSTTAPKIKKDLQNLSTMHTAAGGGRGGGAGSSGNELQSAVAVPKVMKDANHSVIQMEREHRVSAGRGRPSLSSAGAAPSPSCAQRGFAVPPHWRTVLPMKQMNAIEVEDHVLALELAAHEAKAKTSVAMQRLMSLQNAVPVEKTLVTLSSPSSSSTAAPPVPVHPAVYELWVTDRLKSKSLDRPWGVPLVAAYFEASDIDEYFISTKDYQAQIEGTLLPNTAAGNNKEKKGSQKLTGGNSMGSLYSSANASGLNFFSGVGAGAAARSSYGGRHGRTSTRTRALNNSNVRSNQAHRCDFVPFEMPKVKLPHGLRQDSTEHGAALIDILPKDLAQVKLRKVDWALDDMADEMDEIKRTNLLGFVEK